MPISPALQQPVQHSAFRDEQHPALLATALQLRTNEPTADNLQEQPRPIAMQQPAAAEPAAQPGGSASAALQPLSRDRLTVEVPAAAQPHAAAAIQVDDGPVRSAVGSPSGQQWSDPLQTVRLPGHQPVLNSAFQWCTYLHASAVTDAAFRQTTRTQRGNVLDRSNRHEVEQHRPCCRHTSWYSGQAKAQRSWTAETCTCSTGHWSGNARSPSRLSWTLPRKWPPSAGADTLSRPGAAA